MDWWSLLLTGMQAKLFTDFIIIIFLCQKLLLETLGLFTILIWKKEYKKVRSENAFHLVA